MFIAGSCGHRISARRDIQFQGADGFAVLMGHDSGDLVQMSQVMNGPGREQLGQSRDSERGMAAAAVQVRGLKVQGAQLAQAYPRVRGQIRRVTLPAISPSLSRRCPQREKGSNGRDSPNCSIHLARRHPVGAVGVNK